MWRGSGGVVRWEVAGVVYGVVWCIVRYGVRLVRCGARVVRCGTRVVRCGAVICSLPRYWV